MTSWLPSRRRPYILLIISVHKLLIIILGYRLKGNQVALIDNCRIVGRRIGYCLIKRSYTVYYHPRLVRAGSKGIGQLKGGG
jgi:5,10-methylene-tetrahydrofolate dehydrogenase/methenyl tetrahydrofolate cyclohydrolase